MKKLRVVFLAMMLVGNLVQAQYIQGWSEPLRLTDTISFNTNPVIALSEEYYSGDILLFYEKQFSLESPKQIWMQTLSGINIGQEIALLANDTFAYRNPKILYSNFLIYESNLNGNFDIYGIEFDESGIIGTPFQLTNTAGDEKSIYISSDGYDNGLTCWEYEGKIFVSEIISNSGTIQFSEIDTLDSGDCHDPVCSFGYVAWRKVENNESHLFFSDKLWPAIQWSEPDTIFATGDNINLHMSNSIIKPRTLCWENADSILFLGDFYYPEPIVSPHFDSIDQFHQPSAYNYGFITDYYPELYSFVGEVDNQTDIYIFDGMYSTNPFNITNDTRINSNPILYSGKHYSNAMEVINVWQTQINGYEVLFKSDAIYFLGAIPENNNSSFCKITISPNPAKETVNFEFGNLQNPQNLQQAQLRCYDVFGSLLHSEAIVKGQKEVVLDISSWPSGIYVAVVYSNGGVVGRSKFVVE
jgi:hypothetical protein